MSCLIYCVMGPGTNSEPLALRGVGGRPVLLASTGGLSAAWSRLDSAAPPADVSQVVQYQQVVESFHRDRTVIPMRYGCLTEDEYRIIHHLNERDEHYRTLLRDLKGCVEMGIRVLLPDRDPEAPAPVPGGPGPLRTPDADRTGQPSGHAYLSARRSHYTGQDRLDRRKREIIRKCLTGLTGLFHRCRVDKPSQSASSPLFGRQQAALYFLVRRQELEPFRNAFRTLRPDRSAKLLLSGPWPPYNFVLPKDSQTPDQSEEWSGNG